MPTRDHCEPHEILPVTGNFAGNDGCLDWPSPSDAEAVPTRAASVVSIYDGPMSMDDGLFDVPSPSVGVAIPQPLPSDRVADWQVAQLRQALDGLGLTDVSERQRLIERLVGRPVQALRDLTPSEATSLREQLAAKSASAQRTSGSSWDDRDEDTWIDRL